MNDVVFKKISIGSIIHITGRKESFLVLRCSEMEDGVKRYECYQVRSKPKNEEPSLYIQYNSQSFVDLSQRFLIYEQYISDVTELLFPDDSTLMKLQAEIRRIKSGQDGSSNQFAGKQKTFVIRQMPSSIEDKSDDGKNEQKKTKIAPEKKGNNVADQNSGKKNKQNTDLTQKQGAVVEVDYSLRLSKEDRDKYNYQMKRIAGAAFGYNFQYLERNKQHAIDIVKEAMRAAYKLCGVGKKTHVADNDVLNVLHAACVAVKLSKTGSIRNATISKHVQASLGNMLQQYPGIKQTIDKLYNDDSKKQDENYETKKQTQYYASKMPKEKTDPKKTVESITARDFIIRGNAFVCRSKEHKIEDINAIVDVINRRGEIHEVQVHAAYCHHCKLYFLLESEYQRLCCHGIPVCRVSDEKTYRSGEYTSNGMFLKYQSILMEYGYNVSQKDDLSPATRTGILAMLIDNGIVSKTTIISYLDFFISQRMGRPEYNIAVGKWESDREFIVGYRAGTYRQLKIKSITRQ